MPRVAPGLVRWSAQGGLLGGCFLRSDRFDAGRGDLCQAEVENLGMSALGYKDVCRFDVPVNNTLGVGCVERVRNLNAQRQHCLHLQRFARNEVLERHAIEKLHGDECLRVLFADFVDGADVGMVQGRRRLGLAFETRESLRVAG